MWKFSGHSWVKVLCHSRKTRRSQKLYLYKLSHSSPSRWHFINEIFNVILVQNIFSSDTFYSRTIHSPLGQKCSVHLLQRRQLPLALLLDKAIILVAERSFLKDGLVKLWQIYADELLKLEYYWETPNGWTHTGAIRAMKRAPTEMQLTVFCSKTSYLSHSAN